MVQYCLDPSFQDWDTPEAFERIKKYEKPDGLDIIYRTIPGVESESEIEIKIYRPHSNDQLPMIMNAHGGGFVAGSYENDNNRVTYLAMHTPAVVVSLNYRLAPEHVFPEALMDCLQVWNWMYEHADEIGGIKEKMGLYGTSAGGNLCAGLAFYIRDHGGPKISFNALNTPCLGLGPTLSAEQMRYNAPILSGHGLADNIKLYIGGLNGQIPSYYAVPNMAVDCSGLPPTLVIAAEFDPLRDDSFRYVRKLMEDAIPVEFYMTPRTIHGFTAVQCGITEWVNAGTVLSFQREFGKLTERGGQNESSEMVG